MTDRVRLRLLAALAAAQRDARLAALSQARAARDGVAQGLAALDATVQAAGGADPVGEARRAEAYGRWAAGQRLALNRALARRTAAWLEARAAAQIAAGRAAALESLAARTGRARRDQES